MTGSFGNFVKETHDSDGNRLYWGRAKYDGAPFRGDAAPLLTEEEFDAKLNKVYDCFAGVFCSDKPDMVIHGRTYAAIMNGVVINWFKLLSERKYRWEENDKGEPVMYTYVEWAEPYKELDKPITGD